MMCKIKNHKPKKIAENEFRLLRQEIKVPGNVNNLFDGNAFSKIPRLVNIASS